MHTDLPRTLQEAIIYFADPDNCHSFLVAIRWPNGVKCPHCGSSRITWLANQQRWKCRQDHPRRQFSVRVGTIFEESPLGLDKWLAAVWMTVNAKNGISSYEVHRALGVTQKTAWFMGHRIRMALHAGSFKRLLEGDVEVDETFIGGKARNMHSDLKGTAHHWARSERQDCRAWHARASRGRAYHHRAESKEAHPAARGTMSCLWMSSRYSRIFMAHFSFQ